MDNSTMQHHTKIGLALGSGSARGWAHLGVIRAIKELEIEIACVAGTSIGAVAGAAFVLNRVDELDKFARGLDRRKILSFMDVTFPRSGLIDGEKLKRFFREQFQELKIEDLPLPYSAVATELESGNEMAFKSGNLIDSIRASVSVPGILTPVRIGNRYYADGGLVNPLPVCVCRDMGAEKVIAVDLNGDLINRNATTLALEDTEPKEASLENNNNSLSARFDKMSASALNQFKSWFQREPVPSIFEVLTNSINIMEVQITENRISLCPPDVLIRPKLGHIRILDFDMAEEAIEEGYRAAMESLSEEVLD